MNHVDALSRGEVVAYIDEADLDFQLQCAQNRDENIVSLRNKLETSEITDFELKIGLVYHKSSAGNLQLNVPSETNNNVIKLIHEKIDHLAVDKCYAQIKKIIGFRT